MNDLHVHSSYIHDRIYEIRGQKVMLDFDLAKIYGVETKNLNLSVKRNIKRFPVDFMFQLTSSEWESLRFQSATSKRGGRRYLPYAFTEHGIAMLSGILNSDTAIEVNISIIKAFIYLRQFRNTLSEINPSELRKEIDQLKVYLEYVFADYNEINEDTRLQIELINQSIAELQADKTLLNMPPRRKIGFTSNE